MKAQDSTLRPRARGPACINPCNILILLEGRVYILYVIRRCKSGSCAWTGHGGGMETNIAWISIGVVISIVIGWVLVSCVLYWLSKR